TEDIHAEPRFESIDRKRLWRASVVSTVTHIVNERVDPGSRHVRVLCQVPIAIEEGVGVASFGRPDAEVIEEGIDPRSGHVGVLCEIRIGLEGGGVGGMVGWPGVTGVKMVMYRDSL